MNYALKEANDAKLDQKEEKDQVLNFERTNGKYNPKTSNYEELRPFEYKSTERIIWQITECYLGQCHNRNNWRTWQVASKPRRQERWCYKNWWGTRYLWNNLGYCNKILIKIGKNQSNMPKPSNYYRKTWNEQNQQ